MVDEKATADPKFVRDDGSDAGRAFQLQPQIADDDPYPQRGTASEGSA